MRKLLLAVTVLFSFNAHAVNSSMGLYGASTDTECVSTYCGRQEETSGMLAVSMDGKYAGGEVLFTDNGGGFSGYLKHNFGGLILQAGAMLLPDVAYGSAAGFPEVKASATELAPFVGLKYGYLSVRYTQYSAEHGFSSSRPGIDPVTSLPITEYGIASTKNDMSAFWAGLVVNF